jgi:hypothetical protein
MTLLRLARRVLPLARRALPAVVLTAAAIPAATAHAGSAAATRTPDPYHCAAPAHVGNGSGIALTLDWPRDPVPPGTPQALGIHLTNLASLPTPDPTLVVVHGFVPNTYTADPGVTLTGFGTGVSFSVPAGISPGATVSRTVTVKLGASIPPDATEHCDVSAFTGTDQATSAYDVVTGDPVVHPTAAVLPAKGRPGGTVELQAVLGNAGPSNEYTGPAVFTFTAPEHTRWASPPAYRCAPDATGRLLTCTYPGSPLTWRDELEQLPLTIDASARPGTAAHGGCVTATDPFAPQPFHGAEFSVDVTG